MDFMFVISQFSKYKIREHNVNLVPLLLYKESEHWVVKDGGGGDRREVQQVPDQPSAPPSAVHQRLKTESRLKQLRHEALH